MQARDRRVLLLGGAAIVIAYVAFRGIPRAIAAVSNLEDQVQAQTTLLQSARRQVAQREVLSDSLELLRDAVARVTAQLLEARTFEDAAAELQSRITVALARHPIRLDHVRALSDSMSPVPARVRAVAALETDVRGLVSGLEELEKDPRIFVARISIAAASPSVGDSTAEALRVELEVEAFFVPGERASPHADSASATGGKA